MGHDDGHSKKPGIKPGGGQEALRVSEARYRRLFETAQDGILILDAASGAITDVNPFLLEMLGYSLEECVGKRLWELGPFKDVEESQAAFEELQKKEYIRYEDLPLETRDGRLIDVEFVSNAYPVNGNRVIQCNIRDITSRKRAEGKLRISEARYRRLFETAQDGILILDAASGAITDVNPYLLEMLGYSLEDCVGKRLWELGPFKDVEESQAAFEELQKKEYIRYEDLPLETRDGRLIDVEFVSNAYPVDGNRVIQCNIRDITSRKRAEEVKKPLEAAFRELQNKEYIRYEDCRLKPATDVSSTSSSSAMLTWWTGIGLFNATSATSPAASTPRKHGVCWWPLWNPPVTPSSPRSWTARSSVGIRAQKRCMATRRRR